MTLTLPPPGVEVALLALVIGAAVYDLRYRRIPNWLSAGGAAIGLGLNSYLWARGGDFLSWYGLLFALKGLGLGFGIYFVLYVVRAMGAGDVKLMGAIGALIGLENWFGVFVLTALLGGAAAVALAVLRKRLKTTLWNVGFILTEMKSGRPAYLGKEELDVRSSKSVGLPHGAVIAMATVVFLGMSAYYTR